MAIRKNSKVHTGANIQFGGLKNGLLNDWYQKSIEGVVTFDPKYAVEKQRAIDNKNR